MSAKFKNYMKKIKSGDINPNDVIVKEEVLFKRSNNELPLGDDREFLMGANRLEKVDSGVNVQA